MPNDPNVISPALAQKLVRWQLGAILGLLATVAPITWGYVKNVATTADITAKINLADHGNEDSLPPPPPGQKRARPPEDGVAASLDGAWKEINAAKDREKLVEQQRRQLLELWRWHVRWLASDAEQDKRKRMSAGEVAVGKFNTAINEGMTPDNAARYALETSPYR